MYLSELEINNFRRLANVKLKFEAGLNIILGPNNVGKSAVIEALRSLLAGADDPYPRFVWDDVHCPKGGERKGQISFKFVFRDLDADEEADFLGALTKDAKGAIVASVTIQYGEPDKVGRLKVKRWCGDHEDNPVTSDMLENLRSVYLPPLRDASQGLKPGRSSQLARLVQLLSDEAGRDAINKQLLELDKELKKQAPLVKTYDAIDKRHKAMIGTTMQQAIELGLSGTDFQKLSARLSMLVDTFEIEHNGLGFNNLLFMAVVLSELAMNLGASFRSLIVEEPEAHLHPQLQSILLKYLTSIESSEGEKPVQLFVTSHSPNFASIAQLKTIVCLVETETGIEAFAPRDVTFNKGDREKLERYLDVTRGEIFFARRIIFVEGAAEQMMIHVLAEKTGYNLRDQAVSVISVDGLNFDCFLPLFGELALKIPVAVLTDADPQKITSPGTDPIPHYPASGEAIAISDTAASLKKLEDKFVKVFYGQKTFEYDLALEVSNIATMLAGLKSIHPQIGAALEAQVALATSAQEKAKALFQGMFERPQNNVQKGKFGQALAAQVQDNGQPVSVPDYIKKAISHVCDFGAKP